MSFQTRSELITAIAGWLNRTDNIPIADFITLAEGTMARRLRRRTQRVRTTFIAARDHYDLVGLSAPVFGEVTMVRLVKTGPAEGDTLGDANGWWPPLTMTTPYGMSDWGASFTIASRPRAFCVIDVISTSSGAFGGKQLVLSPTPDQDYTAEIWGRLAFIPLSTSVELLRESPDLYLYGALMHAAPYLEHDERVGVWRDLFERAVVEVNQQRKTEELSGAPMPIRLPVILTG